MFWLFCVASSYWSTVYCLLVYYSPPKSGGLQRKGRPQRLLYSSPLSWILSRKIRLRKRIMKQLNQIWRRIGQSKRKLKLTSQMVMARIKFQLNLNCIICFSGAWVKEINLEADISHHHNIVYISVSNDFNWHVSLFLYICAARMFTAARARSWGHRTRPGTEGTRKDRSCCSCWPGARISGGCTAART